eukprot:115986-Alexandrium_andersonii.AAC.1
MRTYIRTRCILHELPPSSVRLLAVHWLSLNLDWSMHAAVRTRIPGIPERRGGERSRKQQRAEHMQ